MSTTDIMVLPGVKMGGGPHGGRCAKHTCKHCGTVHGFRVCPFCGKK